MTDDIVTRLRAGQEYETTLGNHTIAEWLWEAANEIERLCARIELDQPAFQELMDKNGTLYKLATTLQAEIERLRAEKAELLEAIRLTAEYYLPPALDNWEWWKAYSKYADPTDVQRMKDYCDKANEQVVRGE